jgi:hypothetical protein
MCFSAYFNLIIRCGLEDQIRTGLASELLDLDGPISDSSKIWVSGIGLPVSCSFPFAS